MVTTQKLQGRMPNAAIIASPGYSELPKTINEQLNSYARMGVDTHYNTYKLTPSDKDSIYKAAYNSNIVQQAIKAKFNGKSKLYEMGYEIEFMSLLINDSISNEDKKKLLSRRILADWQYDEVNGRPVSDICLSFVDPAFKSNTANVPLQRIESRQLAIKDFKEHNKINFSGLVYLIDMKPYGAQDQKSMQRLLDSIRKANIASIKLLAEVTSVYGNRGEYGVILITTKPD